jgi:hypothetical protein
MSNHDVVYTGPKAEFATLTGSPLWGISVDDFTEQSIRHGWIHMGDHRTMTPYGEGPIVQHFTTHEGRSIIRIPSYGGVAGRDWLIDQTDHKVFWILWQAGVKVLLIGGTSGITDWREPQERIQPGDFVLPWSFRTSLHHRGLPGTPFEIAWPHKDLVLDDPFCTELAHLLNEAAQPYVDKGLLGRIHTPQNARVALVIPDGITFETTYDILMWNAINKMASEMTPNEPPIVTLHGDCVNPVLARLLGIHVAYYHMVANVAQGLPAPEGIVDSLYPLYLQNFLEVALQMEFQLLETMTVPSGQECACIKSVHTAPEVFIHSMTE